MRKTLRTLGLCALAALAIVSCKKNDEQAATMSFEATINQPTNGTRTEIGANNWMIWKNGDAIKVFTADGSASAPFTTTADGVPVANFTGQIKDSDSYCAFYPAANVNAEAGSTTVTLTLDANQIYKNGTFSTNTYPLTAKSDESDKTRFNFHSPCGLLAIPVKGTGTLGSIELTGNNGEKLAGTYTYNLDDMTCQFNGTATKVTLTCEDGLTLNENEAATMIFVLPADTLSEGFTVVLKGTNDTELYRLETTLDKTIEPCNILTMDTVKVDGIDVTTTEIAGTTEVGNTTATLKGSYILEDGMAVSEVGFYWGSSATTLNNRVTGDIDRSVMTTISFSCTIDGLEEGSEYFFQAFVKNGEREYTGPVESFTTNVSFTAPTVTTGTAEATSATAAMGHVKLTNAGTGTVSQIGLCWGTTENPTVNATANNFAAAAGQTVNTEYEVAIANLEPATQYYVRGYAKVGDDYYYAESSVTFTTELPGVESFTVDFENGLPEGWTTIDADGDGYNWVLDTECESAYGYDQSNAGFNGSHMILSGSYHKTAGALHPDNYLVSPKVTLRSGSTFSFNAGAQDYQYPAEHFGVCVSDNGTDWTMVQEWTMTAKGASGNRGAGRDGNTRDQGNWHQYTVDLSAYAGEKYIAIRHFNSSDQFFLNVDNIRLGDPEPGTSFSQNFNNSVFPEGWTTIDADGDGYNWVLTNQMAAYGYSAANDGHYGTVGMTSGSYHGSVGPLTPDNYLVTPKVNLVQGSTFSFWACAQDADYPAEHFGVYVSDNGTSGWTMVQEWTMTAKGASGNKGNGRDGNTRDIGNWYQYTVDLSAYAGEKYIAIRHFNCSDEFFLEVDDIMLTVNR